MGMLEIEKRCYEQGLERLAGIDEVGRGPWPGRFVRPR